MTDWESTLRTRHPAPDTTDVPAYYFSLDGGGRAIVTSVLQSRGVELMLEIGSFLCGSAIQWLEASPTLKVIGVDPWSANFASILDRYRDNPVFDTCFARIDDRVEFIESVRRHGPFKSALANVRDYGDRFVPVRAASPQVLPEIAATGARPQLIYFDSNKLLDDLEVARECFPDAILCGDDWTWGADQGFPVRKAVHAFCERHRLTVRADRATWVLETA